jgi:hypothetical protein
MLKLNPSRLIDFPHGEPAMTNGKIFTTALVLLFGLFFFTHDAQAQTVSGYTSIDYYADTNTVDAYSVTDEDYDVNGAYGAWVALSVIDQNSNVMGWQTASDDGTYGYAAVDIQFYGSPGSTYTATGVHKTYAEQYDYYYDYNHIYGSIYYFDYYYFSSFENQGIIEPYYVEFFGPGPMTTRSSQQIILGVTHDQVSVATLSPDHVRVINDDQGETCAGGLQVRQITVQIEDADNRKVTNFSAIAESFADLTTNSCVNGQPSPADCAPADPGGQFTDIMTVSRQPCQAGRSSGCGYTMTSTWSVCLGSTKDLWQYHGETRSNVVKVDGTLKFNRGMPLYAPNIGP